MSRPAFVLIGGVNGAGKSTLTLSIRHKFPNIEIIDPDAIAKDMTGSFSTVDQEQLSAGRKTLQLINQYLNEGRSLMVESTISGYLYLKYIRIAKDAGYRTVFIYVALSSPELSAQRVAKRVSFDGHAIPPGDIKRRYPRSMRNIKVFIRESESAHIYDNSDNYKTIAAFRDGLIHRRVGNIPDWLEPYII